VRRTRSYFLNAALNGVDRNEYPSVLAMLRTKSMQLSRPSRIWSFLDGSEGTILGGACYVWPWVPADPESDRWMLQPSDRHRQGANLAFADGHVFRQQWHWPKPLVAVWGIAVPVANESDRQDLRWLQEGLPEP
jgi:prepilin-type processing-associated H-X9-DG protein